MTHSEYVHMLRTRLAELCEAVRSGNAGRIKNELEASEHIVETHVLVESCLASVERASIERNAYLKAIKAIAKVKYNV